MTERPSTRAEMLAANRRNWDERVGAHTAPEGYDLSGLRAGAGRLNALEEAELPEAFGPLAGRRLVHPQCHFGHDTLTLAQRGAEVTGFDFSPEAIRTARGLATELGLDSRARFVESSVADAPARLPKARFDLAYVTWGALNWLPDIAEWAGMIAHLLALGGRLYLAEGHPAALVFDDSAAGADGRPGWFAPYLNPAPLAMDDPSDYANPHARLQNARTYEWMHGIGAVTTALVGAGLTIRFLREHATVTWQMHGCLVPDETGAWRWPDRPWLPLSYSLLATRDA